MNACTRDLKACEIDPNNWEVAASDCAHWRWTVKEGIEKADVKCHQKAEEKRARRKIALLCHPPTSSEPCAEGTATRALAYTAIQDVAALPPID